MNCSVKRIFLNIYFVFQWIVSLFNLYVLVGLLYLFVYTISTTNGFDIDRFSSLKEICYYCLFIIIYAISMFFSVKGIMSTYKLLRNELLTKRQKIYNILFPSLVIPLNIFLLYFILLRI